MPTDNGDEKIPEQQEEKINLRKLKTRIAKVRRILLGRYLWLTRISALVLVLFILFLIGDLFVRQITSSSTGDYLRWGKLFLFPNNQIVKMVDGRTNILILGKGGGSHEAPDLTDTMIFASISHNEPHEIDLISLPRDIWIPDLEAKLNSVYYWGNEKQSGGGLVFAKSNVEKILGQQIHYAAVFDFEGFKEVIDILGGVDVQIENGFTDERFPIEGKENDLCGGDIEYNCRYETITFEQGVEHMNGERALKYVRSRHSEDLEAGTDIARSQRQRMVIEAVVSKLTSREIIFSSVKLKEILETVQENTETDLNEDALAVLARRAYQGKNAIESYTIPEDLLYNPPYIPLYNNLYVFIPKAGGGNWSEIQNWVKDTL